MTCAPKTAFLRADDASQLYSLKIVPQQSLDETRVSFNVLQPKMGHPTSSRTHCSSKMTWFQAILLCAINPRPLGPVTASQELCRDDALVPEPLPESVDL
ncbi:hypothetical protein TorRG33x02_077000 [Trema orientale]|uniref:Uncharacterized protein n=1 Tax=Trema orientale TaxID=63057 RepID=A0A2P5FF49_TREOI|nr:hypothetical protein TorRG33x02_077000 [Trema orientale]